MELIKIFNLKELVKIAIVKINEDIAGNLVRKCYSCDRIVTLNEILMENESENQIIDQGMYNFLEDFLSSKKERPEIDSLEDKAVVLIWGYTEDSEVVGIISKTELDLFWSYHYIDPNLEFDYGIISKNICAKCLMSFIFEKYTALRAEISQILSKLKEIVEDDFS